MAPALLEERYELLSEIASGGMATVYRGRVLGPAGFTRLVAIKRLHAQYAKDPEFVAMFMDEARLAARIAHRNVVPTLDVVLSGGELFLVMEHVTGISLARLLRAVRQPPIPITAAIVSGVCHGLHAAHEAVDPSGHPLQIVHRDVSPHNVMISEDGTARVVDFGIAKAVDALHTTRDGSIKGKLAYMPCEQLEGVVLDRRTDVYAAAVVLWEMLTGRRLIAASTDAAIITAIRDHDFESPSRLNPAVSEALDTLVMTGLRRERVERFATCRAMAAAIEECCEVATAGRVADWLETQFGDELGALRAALVEQAESKRTVTIVPLAERSPGGSSETPEPVSAVGLPVTGGVADSASTDVGSVPDSLAEAPPRATSSSGTSRGRSARRRLAWPLALALVALGGVAAFVVMGRARPSGEPAAGLGSSDAPAPTGTQGPALVAPRESPGPTAAACALPSGPAAVVAPTQPLASQPLPSHSAPTATAPRAGSSVTPPAPTVDTSAARNCDPPYAVGTDGIKRYKPWCL